MFQQSSIPAAAVFLLAACVLAAPAGGAQEVAQADSSRRVCTQEYDPVCARRGTSYRTFGNACEAQVAGYFVDSKGRCDFDRGGQERDEQVFCTREYDPVCAVGRRGEKTFGNACEAQAAGYRIVHGGRC
jgi:hypothetical protein